MNWNEIENSDLGSIVAWAADQSWAQAMAACAQDAKWHAEGDVWTHTKLVCEQLSNLEGWSALSDANRRVLLFVALLHDVAKPLTSVVDSASGHIRSPQHAVKGEQFARGVLRGMGCDLRTREQICGLVRYHGRPAFLVQRDKPAHEVIRLSWLVDNNRLLYLFALADTRGRETDSMERPEENLHFWKLQSQDLDCFESPYRFASNLARFTYFRQADPNLHYVPFESFSCRVTMVCGLPGSGKDTWLRKHRPALPVVALDDIRRELGVAPTDDQGTTIQLALKRCREHLRSGRSFSFNATNLLRQTRARWINLFADYRAEVELVYLEPQWAQLLKQNRERPGSVPEHVVQRLATKVEPPNWLECHRLVTSD